MNIAPSLRAISYHAGIVPLRGPLTLRRIFTHAWQLQTRDGWIVTVAALLYNGPLAIRVAQLDGRNLRPNMPAMLDPDSLTIGPIRIHLQGAILWQPHPPEHAEPILPAALASDIQRLLLRDGSVGTAAPSLSAPALAYDGQGWGGQERYGRGMYHLAGALAMGDAVGMREAVLSLLGLGPGLTPSGDDLLCGVLAGLYVMGRRLPRHRAWAERVRVELGEIVEEMAPSRTTALSRTLLHWAAQGEATAPLLDVLCTLGSGSAVRGLPDLLGIGHHSGADMLAGALLAAGVMLEQEEASGEALVRAAECLL